MLTTKDFIAKCKNENNLTQYYVNFDSSTKSFKELSSSERDTYYDGLLLTQKTKAARLAITLGPVIKRHENKVKSSLRFQNRKNYQSLLDIKDVEIKPREAISVLSSEFLQLDNSSAGIILPRLSLTDVGLTLVPTYIDPHWKGILQMTIVNNTGKPISLKLGEAIGVLFIFELSNEVGDEFKDHHATSSHHYGMNWRRILETEEEPIPTKKQVAMESTFTKLKNWLSEHKAKLYKAVGIVSVSVFLYFLAGVVNDINNFKSDLKAVTTLAKENQDKLSTNTLTGSQEITLEPSQIHTTKTIRINQNIRSTPVIFIPQKFQNDGITITGKISSKLDQTAKEVTFTLRSNKAFSTEQSYQFEWILIP